MNDSTISRAPLLCWAEREGCGVCSLLSAVCRPPYLDLAVQSLPADAHHLFVTVLCLSKPWQTVLPVSSCSVTMGPL